MLILIAIITLVVSFAIAPLSISYAHKFSLIDVANHRSSHVGITPRGGGIVFILTFFAVMVAFPVCSNGLLSMKFFCFAIFALLMAVIGWLDDFKNLRVIVRFCIQTAIVAVSCIFMPRIWDFFPIYIEKTIIIFAWMWFINLYNFMDGTDGYATQETFVICLGLFILGCSLGNAALILGCSTLGFLRVNYPKAKIFMGDAGSIFLGYVLGGLIIYSISLHEISIVQAAVLTSLFIFDATFTLFKRAIQRKKVWQAHREHWYQRLNITGSSHKVIFYIGVVYNLIVITLLILNKSNIINDFILAVISLLLLCTIALYIKNKESQNANLKYDKTVS